MRRRPLGAADHRHHEQCGAEQSKQAPPPRHPASTCERPEPLEPVDPGNPQSGDRRDEADRWFETLVARPGRGPDGIVESRRILAPERVGGRRHTVFELALSGAGARGWTDRHQLLRRPQPIAGQPYDVLLVPSQPATVFGSSIARFHGFADLSSVRVPVRLRGEVQYKPVLDPICLN